MAKRHVEASSLDDSPAPAKVWAHCPGPLFQVWLLDWKRWHPGSKTVLRQLHTWWGATGTLPLQTCLSFDKVLRLDLT